MAGRIKALSLYKSILRAHDKFLPHSMRQLGDAYVKSEFRLHKSAKEEQASQFFVEWGNYLQHIERTGREKQSMDVGLVDKPTANSNGMMMNGGSGSGSGGGGTQQQNKSSFGRDVATGIEFNDEQVDQLDKLREEAAKVAGAGGNNDGNDNGGGGGGGGGSGNVI